MAGQRLYRSPGWFLGHHIIVSFSLKLGNDDDNDDDDDDDDDDDI